MKITGKQLVSDVCKDTPEWIETKHMDGWTIDAIQQGGCASGAYMPAVTYYDAAQTMAKHGDDVLQYIDDVIGLGEVRPPKDSSWSGIACFYLSLAVELWVGQFEIVEETCIKCGEEVDDPQLEGDELCADCAD